MGKYVGAALCLCIVLLATSVGYCQYADLGRRETKKAITEQLEEFDNPTKAHGRYYAAKKLKAIYEQSQFGYLLVTKRYNLPARLTNKNNSLLRLNAAILFAELKDSSPESVKVLLQALKDTNAGVRYWAVVALGEAKAKEAIPPIIKLLDDDDSIRMRCIEALGEIGCVEAVEALMNILLNSKRPGEIEKVITALRQITGEDYGHLRISSKEKRDEAIKRWGEFWNKNKSEIKKLIEAEKCKMK